jgi:hypothetical protein
LQVIIELIEAVATKYPLIQESYVGETVDKVGKAAPDGIIVAIIIDIIYE